MMRKKGEYFGLRIAAVVTLVLFCTFAGVGMGSANITSEGDVKSSSAPIYVPDNHTKIQWAIDNATDGDMIIVDASGGPYYENVVMDKSLILQGEGRDTTIIDGSGRGDVVRVIANGCILSNFSIIGSGSSPYCYGIKIISNNNVISDNNVSFNSNGVSVSSFNNTLVNNICCNSSNGIGIRLESSSHDNLLENNYASNNVYGIVVFNSSNNTLINNINILNVLEGILLSAYSNNNNLTSNVASFNSQNGIYLCSSCNNNILANNTIKSNKGEGIQLDTSSNNTITNNDVNSNNGYGIYLVGHSDFNRVFHNNFNNTDNARDEYGVGNIWDNGYPSGGNYWSDYTGVDLYHGQYQNITGSDGIGDTPYSISGGAQDRYPFMQENGWLTTNCSPGWYGTVIIDCETLDNWSVESDTANGNLTLVPGFIGKAVQLNWSLGTGNWTQGKYTFPEPIKLSNYDIFGVSFHGSNSTPNTVSLMFADTHDVFYGCNFDGINSIDRWMKNLAVPRKLFYKFWDLNTTDGWDEIDWSNINRFFFVVKRPSPMDGGGSGELTVDHLQADRTQQWSRQDKFHTSTGDSEAARNAVDYILSQQDPTTGLFLSWKEEPPPKKAWLYDQALVLRVLTREGTWLNGNTTNNESLQADKLVNFIVNQQMEDGHWPRGWNLETRDPIWDDWVGDQAWMTFALQAYRLKSGNDSVEPVINNASEWLKKKIDMSTGKVVNSTEGNVDVWWAMIATENIQEAERIEEYLLSIWDENLSYWPRGSNNDPMVAIDCQTWVSHFARSPWVNEEEKGMEALGFARRTLVTTDENDTICGFDGMGPVSVWCEGTAQYIAAGGEDSQFFIDNLMSIQNPDGSLPGCPDEKTWESCFGWLSPWSGLAPTAWFYFAITGDPFISIFDTGPGTYPSIFGTHNGTLMPNTDIFVHRIFTYSCSGTGGNSEYVKIWNSTWNVTANWEGDKGDWHNISFNDSFILEKGKTYNYTIRTGSYPQIHHNAPLLTKKGWINCTEFVDANGQVYYDWIPAIKLYF
jgi:parallel beta-helix repeat protein